MHEEVHAVSDPFASVDLSWEEFKSFISADLLKDNFFGGTPAGPRYLFRGHRDQHWFLEPRFDREFKSIPLDERKDRHDMLLANFIHQCRDFPSYQEDLHDRERCVALAQHYGLPTRLLDWTESPYIAAFFAFQNHLSVDHGENNSGKQEKVAIWVLDRRANYWDGDYGVELINPMSWSDAAFSWNERCKRQLGWFTFARVPFRTLQDYVLHLNNERLALRKITLSAALATSALRDLELMRINARELYADLQGAVVSAVMQSVMSDQFTPAPIWRHRAGEGRQ